MSTDYNKRAVTYSLLAHIRSSSTLSNGPLDLFVPIVKKGLHRMNNQGQYKGESITEIKSVVEEVYAIDIPIPVLRNILKLIAKEINSKEQLFVLNNDDSFWIQNYIFDEYDEKLEKSKKDIRSLQTLFKEFCKANKLDHKNEDCIIRFIEKNKIGLSQYLSSTVQYNGDNYIIEAKFVEYFKSFSDAIYEQIKSIYLGAILTSYLDYKPTDIKADVILLFDTNFIVSLFIRPEYTRVNSYL